MIFLAIVCFHCMYSFHKFFCSWQCIFLFAKY